MRRHLRKVRKTRVTKNELIADAVFLLISGFASFLIVFLFDIHHSFYEWPMKMKFIFQTPYPYFIFITAGTLIGFFVIKALLFGIREEQTAL